MITKLNHYLHSPEGYNGKRLTVKLEGYESVAQSNVQMKLFALVRNLHSLQEESTVHGEDMYIYADSCRRVTMESTNSYTINVIAHRRQKCAQKFGSIDYCESNSVSS